MMMTPWLDMTSHTILVAPMQAPPSTSKLTMSVCLPSETYQVVELSGDEQMLGIALLVRNISIFISIYSIASVCCTCGSFPIPRIIPVPNYRFFRQIPAIILLVDGFRFRTCDTVSFLSLLRM